MLREYLCCLLDLGVFGYGGQVGLQIPTCTVLRGRGSTVAVFSLGPLPGLLFLKELGLHGIGGRLLWAAFANGAGDPKPLFS